jgi:hypothetical protein
MGKDKEYGLSEAASAARAGMRLQQILLLNNYRQMIATGIRLPSFLDVGFKAYSQNDEDGVLLFVFAVIGMTNRVVVEIAAGNGIESNSANLILNHGFFGLLFEGDVNKAAEGKRFFESHPHSAYFPPRFVTDWVTRENADQLIRDNLPPGSVPPSGDIDVMSLDIDGNDYWVLEAIQCIAPRVIILEFNAVWGAERAVTIPYDPDFVFKPDPVPYAGASLPAFVKLLSGRGYRLVGVERLGFNAVFVRNDLAPELLPRVTAEECFKQPIIAMCQEGLAHDPRLSAAVKAKTWIEV